MTLSTKFNSLLCISLHLLFYTLLFSSIIPVAAASEALDDYTSLVFKGCSDETFSNNVYPENLKPLIHSLLSNSREKNFFAAITSSSDGSNAINGLYQCRGDLSASECNACVSRIPVMITQLCGVSKVAARVQLRGCYLSYEIAGRKTLPADQLLYKHCDAYQAKARGIGAKRDKAFGIVENNVINSTGTGNCGFYTCSFDSVGVSGQCEGTLTSQDCVACLKSANDKAKVECGDSISGQIYLNKCFIVYSNSADGNANAVLPPSSKADGGSGGSKGGKIFAIVLMSIVCILLVICVLFCIKKHCF